MGFPETFEIKVIFRVSIPLRPLQSTTRLLPVSHAYNTQYTDTQPALSQPYSETQRLFLRLFYVLILQTIFEQAKDSH